MKIAIVLPSLAHKAPILVARDLATGFVEAGHVVKVFYLDDLCEVDFPCDVERTDFRRARALSGFDVVHSHMIRPDILAWLCRNIYRTPGRYVSTIHNIVEDDLLFSHGPWVSAVVSRLWRSIWSGLDGRVVLTEQALKYYSGTQPTLRFNRIYNGRSAHCAGEIEKSDLRIIEAAKAKWQLLGACAVVSPRKGLEQVIYALPDLPRYAFLLIGDGPQRQSLMDLAASLGVAERFISLGEKNNARDYLGFMDAYVMPSRSEGLPLALLEAVSADVPVACSNIPQFREIFSSEEVAYFPLDDVKGFVNAVARVEGAGEALRTRARKKFDVCYTQQAMVHNYLRYFGSLRERLPVL